MHDAKRPLSDSPVTPGFFRPDMELAQLQLSPLNPRKSFDQAGLEDLAKSIREVGVIEPLVARPAGDHYEIVAGARRFKASTLAGLTTVPVSVKSLTDQQALEIMVIENNQREDVSALEEADGFSRLLKSGYDPDKLAERLGRSKKYVYDRLKLLDLTPAAKALLGVGKLTAGHAILLARLKPEDQARAIDPADGGAFTGDAGANEDDEEASQTAQATRLDRKKPAAGLSLDEFADLKPRSVRELDRWIAHHVRFKPREAAVAAPLEYGEVAARVEEAAARPGRGKKVIAITFEHYVQPEARDDSDRTFGPRSFKFADGKPHRDYGSYKAEIAKPCEHAVLGVVAVGHRYGQAFDVCIARDKCRVHWKREVEHRQQTVKLLKSGQSAKADKREASAEAKRQRELADQAERDRRQEIADQRALDQAVDGVKELTEPMLRGLLAALVATGDLDFDIFNKRFHTKARWNCDAKVFDGLKGRILAQAVVYAHLESARSIGDFERELKPFGVDLKKVEAAVAKERAAFPVQTSAQKKSPAKKKR